ncbi:MAG: lipoate--protein ligase family protein [Gemmatimonadota bacterium]|nr:lipoate--protein ligase family protein [Gemmatimonadota bacterium]
MRWRYLLSAPLPGPDNMALDDALLARAERVGEGVLRVYAWSRPTLSLGRHQPAAGRYDVESAQALGIAFVRRLTGGRAVLHCREITYSVTAPFEEMGGLGDSYGRINRLLLAALRALGVPAEAHAPRVPAPAPGIAPCFQTPVVGEIEVGGRKLVGSAQVRRGRALLQHGSILVNDDQWLASTLLRERTEATAPAATLWDSLGRAPSLAEVGDALRDALQRLEGTEALPLAGDPELEADSRSALERYSDERWTWRH